MSDPRYHPNKRCFVCHGKGYLHKDRDGNTFPKIGVCMDCTVVACPDCKGSGVKEQFMEELLWYIETSRA